jgi:hypothetical protein
MPNLATSLLAEPPFAPHLNEHWKEAGERSIHWAVHHGLVSTSDGMWRLARANAAELAARACPDTDVDHLGLVTDLITWLFAFDDSCDDDGLGADPARLSPVVSGLLDVLDLAGGVVSPPEAAGPAGAALHDLCRRVRARAAPSMLLRFTGRSREYLLALLWEAANRKHHRVPPVTEYIQMRRHTGGVHPSFTLTDIAHGTALSARHRTDHNLSMMDRLAADLVCWCNDVFSYHKERQLGTNGHNLAMAIARENGEDNEQCALADVADRFNTALAAYLRLESAVLAGTDPNSEPDVARFAAARRCWIRGTYDWSRRASRYN